ncbi:glycerol uptake facilitator-like aquaporin [Arthrobacter sp. AG258]|uniref:MIP/aquaporin family protein n=1 Tax=Arthrobacter sp. AG258 TaxID=2183899 RepID=UPI0010615CCE|nr:aquaporin [Arthrobacter sp. AG258]TDT82400.1 glycerol uptake facilitator-like aquaporin [Arthrobacter sp. AG258]
MSTPVPARDALQPGGTDPASRALLPRLAAEAFGSLFLAVAGLGVPLFSIPQSSPVPAALAAGLAITAAMLAFGHISGGHFNPAITLGHLLAGRIRAGAAAAYAAAQLVGALVGALALFGILRTLPGIPDSRTAFDTVAAGFGDHSIIQAPLAAVVLLELLGAAIIVAIFLGAAGRDNGGLRDNAGVEGSSRTVAAVAVGLSFAALLQVGQSVGNLPFNPARALASAVFSSGAALGQVWVFLVAPLAGAAIAGLVFRISGTADATHSAAAADAADHDDDASVEAGGGDAGAGSSPVQSRIDDDADAPGAEPNPSAARTAAPEGQARNVSEAQEFFEGKRS